MANSNLSNRFINFMGNVKCVLLSEHRDVFPVDEMDY